MISSSVCKRSSDQLRSTASSNQSSISKFYNFVTKKVVKGRIKVKWMIIYFPLALTKSNKKLCIYDQNIKISRVLITLDFVILLQHTLHNTTSYFCKVDILSASKQLDKQCKCSSLHEVQCLPSKVHSEQQKVSFHRFIQEGGLRSKWFCHRWEWREFLLGNRGKLSDISTISLGRTYKTHAHILVFQRIPLRLKDRWNIFHQCSMGHHSSFSFSLRCEGWSMTQLSLTMRHCSCLSYFFHCCLVFHGCGRASPKNPRLLMMVSSASDEPDWRWFYFNIIYFTHSSQYISNR